MKISSILLSVLMVFALSQGCNITRPDAPIGLKVNYFINPLGIDDPAPRFSWQVNDTNRSAVQSAFQLMVSSTAENLASGKGDMWNSGKVISSENLFIPYTGKNLESANGYYWKVKTWNGDGKESEWSKPQWFETALLHPGDWKAAWISTREPATKMPPRSVYVRKELKLKDAPVSARLYVTGLGNYVFHINGKRVGNDLLTPGWTDYNQKIQYQVYDITGMLTKGLNAAGAVLGNMWWSSGLGWNGGTAYSRGPLSLLAQIRLVYPDGSIETIGTDSSWMYHFSPVVFNHIYDGEEYDSRLEIAGWNQPGLDESNWKNMVKADSIHLRLVAQQEEPIRVTAEIPALRVSEPKKGIYVFDLGQNMVGTAKITLQGKAGDRIVIRYAELLHPDSTVAQENLRSAKATDAYTLKSDQPETYTTTFTYHGFRYVQLEGLREKPRPENVTGLVFHTNASSIGEFSCSNPLINQIYKNIRWGQISNMMSVPTDCPQRDERLGWMGDAQIFAPTANFNMDMNAFFAKWEKDILDCQDSSGYVTDVNPAIVVTGPAKPGWGDAVVMIPYQVYRFYGDKKILEDSYQGMMKWITYMEKLTKDYIYEFGDGPWGGYGDWVAVVPSPTKPTGALYYYYSTKIMAEIAGILGKTEDSTMLAARLPKIAQAYQQKYFQPDSGHYISNTQTMNLLPVAFGITPEKLRAEVIQKVADDVEKRGDHLTTGFMGTAWLLPLLCDYNYPGIAYRVATRTSYPSWGYMIEKGATTMWELWNSDTEKPEGMNSRNHFAYGSVGEWYYEYLAGIKPDIQNPGFRHSIIAPCPLGDLNFAEARIETGYGLLSSRWEKKGNSLQLELVIPSNTSASVAIPVQGDQFTVREGNTLLCKNGKPAQKENGIQFSCFSDHQVKLEVGSGKYCFVVE